MPCSYTCFDYYSSKTFFCIVMRNNRYIVNLIFLLDINDMELALVVRVPNWLIITNFFLSFTVNCLCLFLSAFSGSTFGLL